MRTLGQRSDAYKQANEEQLATAIKKRTKKHAKKRGLVASISEDRVRKVAHKLQKKGYKIPSSSMPGKPPLLHRYIEHPNEPHDDLPPERWMDGKMVTKRSKKTGKPKKYKVPRV